MQLHQAEDGYARDFSELTLQQILRRLARLLERKARANAAKLAAKKDVTLLHPPPDHDPTFYPDKLKKFPQYRDYFYKKEAKEDARILTHMHKGTANITCSCLRSRSCFNRVCCLLSAVPSGSLRSIDQLDPVCRGGDTDTTFLYLPAKNPGASVHAKVRFTP